MNIGIIGSGNIGGSLGIHWAQVSHQVLFSSRKPETLHDTLARAGQNARSGSVEEAARFGEVVLLAVPYKALTDLEQSIKANLAGKVVIDATNPYPQRDGELARRVRDNPNQTATEFVAGLFPDSRFVKAFNTIPAVTLLDDAFGEGNDRIAIPYAGDDSNALETVRTLINDIGFDGVYVDTLASSQAMDVDGSLYAVVTTAKGLSQQSMQT